LKREWKVGDNFFIYNGRNQVLYEVVKLHDSYKVGSSYYKKLDGYCNVAFYYKRSDGRMPDKKWRLKYTDINLIEYCTKEEATRWMLSQ